MRLLVDASVAVKFIVDEEDRQLAASLISEEHDLVAPDILLLEVNNVIWKKVRLKQVAREQALAAVGTMRFFFKQLLPSELHFRRAFELALELDHPVYDCVYLALAEREALLLVTADNRFASRLVGTPHEARIQSLKALPL